MDREVSGASPLRSALALSISAMMSWWLMKVRIGAGSAAWTNAGMVRAASRVRAHNRDIMDSSFGRMAIVPRAIQRTHQEAGLPMRHHRVFMVLLLAFLLYGCSSKSAENTSLADARRGFTTRIVATGEREPPPPAPPPGVFNLIRYK